MGNTTKNIILERAIKTVGMTQQELADFLAFRTGISVSQTTVSDWINGSQKPKEEFVDEMCDLFGISNPEEIFPNVLFFEKQKIEKVVGNDLEAIDLVAHIIPAQPDEAVIHKEEMHICRKIVAENLGEKEKFAILRYFGFIENQKVWTHESIGQEMGKYFSHSSHSGNGRHFFTRERVRQIINEGLSKIRRRL